jgi:hypothetical protein
MDEDDSHHLLEIVDYKLQVKSVLASLVSNPTSSSAIVKLQKLQEASPQLVTEIELMMLLIESNRSLNGFEDIWNWAHNAQKRDVDFSIYVPKDIAN